MLAALVVVEDSPIETRRARVFAMRAKGITAGQIAAELDISASTVRADIAAYARTRRSQLDNAEFEIEKVAAHYEAIKEQAWADYHRTKLTSINKTGFLRLAMDAERELVKLRGLEPPKREVVESHVKSELVIRVGGREVDPVSRQLSDPTPGEQAVLDAELVDDDGPEVGA